MDVFGKFGGLKDSALVVFAEKLGLTLDEVNTRLKAGDTFAVIAESKGITAEKLPAFMQEVCTQVIDQAVKDGKLTQAQADALKTKLQDSDWTEMWGGRGMGLTPKTSEDWSGKMGSRGEMGMGIQDSWMHDELLKAFAAKVGLTVDEVTTRLEAGETHTQIAESKGITGDAYTTLWKAIHTQVIDQAVIDGKLTQAQADAIKARIESNSMPMWGGEFSQGSKGGMMPFGGGRRGK
jgi:polyhydroxyalkanoate synthesis regulator phasin